MRRQTMRCACFLAVLGFALAAPAARAGDFDPEAISQISKGISEWKLLQGEKDESQAERTVYVSSSLGGRTATNGVGQPAVVRGLRAFTQNQVDPILWYGTSDSIKSVPIYQDYSITHAGQNDPFSGASSYGDIRFNPAYMGNPDFAKPYTPGGPDPSIVMAHEIGHIRYQQTWETVYGKGSWIGNPIYAGTKERWADSYAMDFEKTRQARFDVENRIAQDFRAQGANVKVYNSYQDYRLDQSAWKTQLNTIPVRSRDVGGAMIPSPSSQNWSTMGRNSSIDWSRVNRGADATSWGTGVGVSSSSIPRTTIGPPVSSTLRYPPPDVLFSIKDPMTRYTSPRPTYTIPTYPSMPGISTLPTVTFPRLGGN